MPQTDAAGGGNLQTIFNLAADILGGRHPGFPSPSRWDYGLGHTGRKFRWGQATLFGASGPPLPPPTILFDDDSPFFFGCDAVGIGGVDDLYGDFQRFGGWHGLMTGESTREATGDAAGPVLISCPSPSTRSGMRLGSPIFPGHLPLPDPADHHLSETSRRKRSCRRPPMEEGHLGPPRCIPMPSWSRAWPRAYEKNALGAIDILTAAQTVRVLESQSQSLGRFLNPRRWEYSPVLVLRFCLAQDGVPDEEGQGPERRMRRAFLVAE